jgi:hypothetical protein
MLLAQISGSESLREVSLAVASTTLKFFKKTFFYWTPTKYTLSYNNFKRDWKIFSFFFYMMSDVIAEKLQTSVNQRFRTIVTYLGKISSNV